MYPSAPPLYVSTPLRKGLKILQAARERSPARALPSLSCSSQENSGNSIVIFPSAALETRSCSCQHNEKVLMRQTVHGHVHLLKCSLLKHKCTCMKPFETHLKCCLLPSRPEKRFMLLTCLKMEHPDNMLTSCITLTFVLMERFNKETYRNTLVFETATLFPV